MNRIVLTFLTLVIFGFAPLEAFAQDSTPAAKEPDFFATQVGYVGGAQVNFTSAQSSFDSLLVVSSGVAQFDTEENAVKGIASVRETYLTYLAEQDTGSFDFSGVKLQDQPDLGDEAALFAGTVKGNDDTPDLNVSAYFVRVGTILFGIQGVELIGDPIPAVEMILVNIIDRNPQPSALPVDGSSPDAAIWGWLATYDDLDGGFMMADRAWTNAAGVEVSVQPIAAEDDGE